MRKLFTSIVLAAAVTGFSFASAQAAEEANDLKAEVEHAVHGGHFPVLKPKEEKWSFSGLFGKYDKAQLQRGLKVYKEVCSACHSMKRVAFRTLEDLGYNEAQVKAFAAEYEAAGYHQAPERQSQGRGDQGRSEGFQHSVDHQRRGRKSIGSIARQDQARHADRPGSEE